MQQINWFFWGLCVVLVAGCSSTPTTENPHKTPYVRPVSKDAPRLTDHVYRSPLNTLEITLPISAFSTEFSTSVIQKKLPKMKYKVHEWVIIRDEKGYQAGIVVMEAKDFPPISTVSYAWLQDNLPNVPKIAPTVSETLDDPWLGKIYCVMFDSYNIHGETISQIHALVGYKDAMYWLVVQNHPFGVLKVLKQGDPKQDIRRVTARISARGNFNDLIKNLTLDGLPE